MLKYAESVATLSGKTNFKLINQQTEVAIGAQVLDPFIQILGKGQLFHFDGEKSEVISFDSEKELELRLIEIKLSGV